MKASIKGMFVWVFCLALVLVILGTDGIKSIHQRNEMIRRNKI